MHVIIEYIPIILLIALVFSIAIQRAVNQKGREKAYLKRLKEWEKSES